MKTLLLTLGRLPKALDLARAFHGAGWRVVVAEPFGWHLTGISRTVARSHKVMAPNDPSGRYLDDLLEVCVRERVDLIVPVSEEAMHMAGLKGRPGAPPVFGMDQGTVLGLHDKLGFPHLAAGFGLDVPETYRLGTAEAQALADQYKTVTKPVFSCSGRGVSFLDRGTDLGRDGGHDPGDEPMVVQAFVPGTVHSTYSIAHAGRVSVTSIYTGAVMSGTVAVAFARVPERPAIQRWVERFVAATNYTGSISFDFVVTADGRTFAIECNPRVTSGIHFLTPETVARCILEPEYRPADPFRPYRLMQQFFPCLTETQGSLFQGDRFRHNLRHLLRARDVSWRLSDPLPLLTMTATSAPILAQVIFQGLGMGEAATRDIAWRG